MKSLKVRSVLAALFCIGLGIVLIVMGKLILWISGTILIIAGVSLFWKTKSMLKEQSASPEST